MTREDPVSRKVEATGPHEPWNTEYSLNGETTYCVGCKQDWPCLGSLVLAASPADGAGGWSFEGLTGDGWAIIGPDDEERHGDWHASGYGRAMALDREDAVRIVNALNRSPADGAGPVDVERIRVVFHKEYERQDELGGCRHRNQHRSTWDCVERADEFLTEYAALEGASDGKETR